MTCAFGNPLYVAYGYIEHQHECRAFDHQGGYLPQQPLYMRWEMAIPRSRMSTAIKQTEERKNPKCHFRFTVSESDTVARKEVARLNAKYAYSVKLWVGG